MSNATENYIKFTNNRKKVRNSIILENIRSFFKKIIVEGYRAVGSLNDSFQSSNLLLLLLFFIDFGQ